ncbi:putative transposase [Rhizobium petrolearium]|uniref:Transposase n=2 Tax=Neorhizobium TaxID=1525371 RepID=A0ABV0MB52_9HYPH|nr:transposase [Neorhizobium petrolearium]MBP1847382.1 putative transposase [Neorhizobium petrolearium]MCC2614412.1 transposase [Neorhizobium petrolearium]WGI72510.1 transposase [Neorhizobium petrolearium]
MADDETQTPPDITPTAEAEPTTIAAAKRASRARKTGAAKPRAATSAAAKSKRRGLTAEEKQQKIDQIEAQVSGGATLKDAVKTAGISDQTYYQWKKALMQPAVQDLTGTAASDDEEWAEFVALEEENRRLRKLLSEKLRTENAELRRRLGLK